MTAVIVGAWVLAHTVARRRAAARHGIWLCALVFVLLSPGTAILMDRAGIKTFIVHVPAGSPSETTPAIALSSAPASLPGAEPRRHANLSPDISASAREPFLRNEGPAGDRSASATVAAPLSAVQWLRGSAVIGLAIWALGAWCLLARLLWRGRALRRLVRAACPVEDQRLQRALHQVRQSLGVKALPRVLVWGDEGMCITPVTIGVFRPVIVLSAALRHTLSDDELRDVLVHELAHVLRRDTLVGLLQRIAQSGFWPYPLVRLMNLGLTRAREEVCDNYVLHYSDGPQYAQTLFDMARKVVPLSPRWAQLGLLQPCWRLEHRVAGLLDPRRNIMTRLNRFSALILAAAFLAIALLAAGTKILQAEPQSVNPAGVAAADKPAPLPQPTTAKAASPQKQSAGTPAPNPPAGLAYTCRVTEKGTAKPIAGATVTVRRMVLAPYERKVLEEPKYQTNADGKYTFTIPPEEVANRFMYIELDVSHPDYAARRGFGYSLSMIRKNETMGERPFFEHVELFPAEPILGTVVTPDGKPAAGMKVLGFCMVDRMDFESASFTETKTDDKGEFRLNLAKGGDGVFWLLPRDFAPSTHVVLKNRGELGKFALEKGIVVQGRVVDQQKKPLAGVWVNAQVSGGPPKKAYDIPVADMLSRAALTDPKGEFTLAPLPAGEYVIGVDRYPQDSLIEDRTLRIPPAVFGPQPLVLKEGETTNRVELAALVEVVIEGQFYDSKGKPRSGHAPMIWGRMPGKTLSSPSGFYHTDGKMDTNGKFVIRAPQGLQEAKLTCTTNEHSALRVRMKKEGPLSNQARDIPLGNLEQDVRGIEVVRYEAPILLVKPVAEDGTPAKGAKMQIAYATDRGPWEGGGRYVEGRDVHYERQPDGRLRTGGLLPDEEFTVTVTAEGRRSRSETLKLPEGATRELEFKLVKGQDSEKPK